MLSKRKIVDVQTHNLLERGNMGDTFHHTGDTRMHGKLHRAARRIQSAASTAILIIAVIGCGDTPGSRNPDEKVLMYGVVLNDNAALRLDPILYSSRIALLDKGTKVKIIDRSKEKSWIGKSCDYWYKIKESRGITGWLFGSNLRTFESDKPDPEMETYATSLREEDERAIRKALIGKWWSVDTNNNFTDQCVELYDTGKYKSYIRGGKELEGEYDIDCGKKEITFSSTAIFGKNLKYTRRGVLYFLESIDAEKPISFRKISDTTGEPGNDMDKSAAVTKEPAPGEKGKDEG